MRTHRLLLGMLLLTWGAVVLAASMPSNTLYLDDSGRADTSQVLARHRVDMAARARALEHYRRVLVQRRLISPNTVLPQLETFIVRGTAGRALPAGSRSYGNGTLTFAFSGWSSGEETALRAFLNEAYPVLVNLYGAPAQTATLTLARGEMTDSIWSGTFDLQSMRLTLEPLPDDFTSGDSRQYGYNLLHQVLHAFHAPALIGYDAWEEGMAWAAAAVAMTQLRPSTNDFNLAYSFNYVLPLYDRLNQEALASPTFFSPQGMPYMSLWRVGMAMSAWLKVYGEPTAVNQSIFKAFNNAYYAQYAASSSVSANLGALQGLMATVTPSVEGMPFQTWYDQQYVLRPVVQVGTQVFLYSVASDNNSITLMLHYYHSSSLSTPNGIQASETALNGTAALSYHGYDGIELYPLHGDTMAIPYDPGLPGIGFLTPILMNIGEDEETGLQVQRVRITGSIGGKTIETYFPYMCRGDITDENEFFGVLLGADRGSMRISIPGILSYDTPVVQGAFKQQAAMGDLTFFAPVTFTYTPQSGTPFTFHRTVGPGSYDALFTLANQPTTLTHTFFSGLSLVSLPIAPDVTDAAQLFGYQSNPSDLHLAWWDPNASGEDKYRRYPALTQMTTGQGYWLELPAHRTVTVSGIMPSSASARSMTLAPGWNLIGNTFNSALNPWSMTVDAGAVSYTLRDAIRLNIVIGPVWTYHPDGYYEVKPSLAAWEGGWICNLSGSPLVLHQQGASRAVSRATGDETLRLLTEGGWGIQLRARTNTAHDRTALLGVSSNARQGVDGLDWMKPPAARKGVRIAFIHPERRTSGAAYATDIRREVGLKGEEWTFEVQSDTAGPVTINWPDLRAAPAGYQLVLEDVSTGTRRNLRTTPAYQYQATGTADRADVRRFRLSVSPQNAAPFTFITLQVQQTRGSGINLNASLTGDAELVMEVRTLSGKVIYTTRVPDVRANEPVHLTWNGRIAGDKQAPVGAYLVSVLARNAEGVAIRRDQMVNVRR